MEENFAGGKFREIPCAVDIYFAGGKFRAKSKFANIAKISSTRKIRVIQYLIRWVIVTYILLDISVVNSHATSAYECELLAVTWHYLPSVRLGNARSVIRP